MNKIEKIWFLVHRYLPNDASRKEKAQFIRKQRRLMRDTKPVPIYTNGFINRLGLFDREVEGIGGNWFIDRQNGKCYHVVRDGDSFRVDQSRHSKVSEAIKKRKRRVAQSRKKTHEETHVIIKCVDCGTDREIKTCDKHQVKRCKECQRDYKNKKRVLAIQEERRRWRALRDRVKEGNKLKGG